MDVAQEPRAGLGPSAHVDTFCRDSLPPADQWPELLFRLPELAYPDRLNCAEALLSLGRAGEGASADELGFVGLLLAGDRDVTGYLDDVLGPA